MPSGRKVKIQGYEDRGLTELLSEYKESEITIDRKEMPAIWYEYNNKICRYFSDFYIVSTNTIIEIKSNYTMKLNYVKNLLKQEACIKQGFNFEFRIYNN